MGVALTGCDHAHYAVSRVSQVKDREASLANALERLAAFRPAASSSSSATAKAAEDGSRPPQEGDTAKTPEEQEKDAREQKIASLTIDNRLLNEELDRMSLELGKLQHRLARGEYNPARSHVVKVLHRVTS